MTTAPGSWVLELQVALGPGSVLLDTGTLFRRASVADPAAVGGLPRG